MKKRNAQIQLVKHSAIRRDLWDSCIGESIQSEGYGFSGFLDAVCGQWDALVFADYQAVMPLPSSRRYGFRYVYQPFFTQQLGVFSRDIPDLDLMDAFFEFLPTLFSYADLNLNLLNPFPTGRFKRLPRVTHHLDLIADASSLTDKYNHQTKRNLARARIGQVEVSASLSQSVFIQFFREEMANPLAGLPLHADGALRRLINYAFQYQGARLLGAYDSRNQLCGAAFFMRSMNRLYYLAGASNDRGRELQAMTAIMDQVIRESAGNPLVLDFEGSVIPGVARFFKGFGAIPQEYNKLIMNNLPFPFSWFMELKSPKVHR